MCATLEAAAHSLGLRLLGYVRLFVCCLQAARTGYIFGAYFACAWPDEADDVAVADPSGRSFLFSLINTQKKAMKFPLHDKELALQVNDSAVYIGGIKWEGDKQMSMPTVAFMRSGCTGGVANSPDAGAFQPATAAVATRNETYLAGSQLFLEEEVEVYQLARAPAAAAPAAAVPAAGARARPAAAAADRARESDEDLDDLDEEWRGAY